MLITLGIMIITNLFATAAASIGSELLNKANTAELLDIGSGIFALVLFTLSLTAYRNLKLKNLLFVSAAFGMFAIHAIVSGLHFIIPEIEGSVIELFTALISFVSLAFFFFALVKKVRTTTTSPTSI